MIQKRGLPGLQSLPKNGVTGLDHLETVLPTYWSTSFAVPIIPESNLMEEDQDMKKCMRKKSFVEGRQWRQKYQGIWIHFPLFKTLNCSAPGKSCMQHGVMIML